MGALFNTISVYVCLCVCLLFGNFSCSTQKLHTHTRAPMACTTTRKLIKCNTVGLFICLFACFGGAALLVSVGLAGGATAVLLLLTVGSLTVRLADILIDWLTDRWTVCCESRVVQRQLGLWQTAKNSIWSANQRTVWVLSAFVVVIIVFSYWLLAHLLLSRERYKLFSFFVLFVVAFVAFH